MITIVILGQDSINLAGMKPTLSTNYHALLFFFFFFFLPRMSNNMIIFLILGHATDLLSIRWFHPQSQVKFSLFFKLNYT